MFGLWCHVGVGTERVGRGRLVTSEDIRCHHFIRFFFGSPQAALNWQMWLSLAHMPFPLQHLGLESPNYLRNQQLEGLKIDYIYHVCHQKTGRKTTWINWRGAGLLDSGVELLGFVWTSVGTSYHYFKKPGFLFLGCSLWNHWLPAIVVTGCPGTLAFCRRPCRNPTRVIPQGLIR